MKRILLLVRMILALGVLGIVVPFLGFPSQWRLYICSLIGAGVAVCAFRLRARVIALHNDALPSTEPEPEVVPEEVPDEVERPVMSDV